MDQIIRDTVRAPPTHAGRLTFANVVRLCMHCVEQFSLACARPMAGSSKLAMCKEAIPILIAQAVTQGIIAPEQGSSLQQQMLSSLDLVEDIVETLILVSKNPLFIQIRAEVEQATTACAKRCRKGASSSRSSSHA